MMFHYILLIKQGKTAMSILKILEQRNYQPKEKIVPKLRKSEILTKKPAVFHSAVTVQRQPFPQLPARCR